MEAIYYELVNLVRLTDYASLDPQKPAILEADATGSLHKAEVSLTDLSDYIEARNDYLFSVWAVPPNQLDEGGATNGTYVLKDWKSARGTTPVESTVMGFYDRTDGALDPTTGSFTAPVDGVYRHSMYVRMRSYGGNFGIFVQIGGLRHVGDFFPVTTDAALDDCHSFSVEVWHRAGDQVCFQLSTTDSAGSGADGRFAHWSVTRIYNGTALGVPVSDE
ncbi:hypothetical protein [Medusavirus stheno T3]|uniref:C1q domain-containing protein n=1 Tax=Medusavirus stheno T3 TaxID=3069717 RepID=A0A7S8BDS0_9VIRU|nr:hypothetical protein QKU73_gp281 [Acanthamoeba castellanii medusavirus]QPB44494.1 hypothetical protein [Medusavirus stheno T3]